MAIFSFIAQGVAYGAAYLGASQAVAIGLGVTAAGLARNIAVNAVGGYFQSRDQQNFQQQRPDLIATLSQGDAQRTRLYGQGLIGGVRAFHETNDGILHQIILLNDGKTNGVIGYWINNRPVQVNSGGQVITGPQAGRVAISYRNGETGVDGASFTFVSDHYPGIYNTGWLEGQSTIGVAMTPGPLEDFQKTWPRGSQTNIQAEIRGASVARWATGFPTSAYSDNAGEVIANYILQPDGFGIGFSKVFNSPNVGKFARICNEQIPLKDGGTEPRYRIWGRVGFAEQPKAVLERMLAACDCRIYEDANGDVGFIGGKYTEPDFTLTADDIYDFSYSDGLSNRDKFNTVRAFYTDERNLYQPTEADPWEDAAAVAVEGEKSEQFDVIMAPSHSQTRRLMKIHQRRRNRAFTVSLETNLVGIKARFPREDEAGHHTIRVQYPAFDGFDEVCEVLSHVIFPVQLKGGAIEWRCRMELGAIDPEWWEWDAATEEGDAPVLPFIGDVNVPVPLLESSSSSGSAINLTYADISTNYNLHIEGRISGTGTATLTLNTSTNTAAFTGLTPGDVYEFRARYEPRYSSAFETNQQFSGWSIPITVVA